MRSLSYHLCCSNVDLLKEMSSGFYLVRKPGWIYALIPWHVSPAWQQIAIAIGWGRRGMWQSRFCEDLRNDFRMLGVFLSRTFTGTKVSLACKDLKDVAPQIASSFPFPMAWDSRRRGSASIVAARGSTSYKDHLPYVRTWAVGNLSSF